MAGTFKLCNRFGLKSLSICTIILFAISAAAPSARALESQLVERPRRPLFVVLTVNKMPEGTREVAEELEIMPLLEELYNQEHPATIERKVVLHEKIQETILESYFDAASVLAECEREQVYLESLRESLLARRDRNIEINNATNFIGSGALNTVGSILGFSAKTPPFPGNLNQMLAGVVQATMSTYALKQNNGGKIRRPDQPTMLAELFGRPTNPRTRYPESVWRFLHSAGLEHPEMTRAQMLESNWILHNHLERHGSKREPLKLDLVCGVGSKGKVMTLDDLSDEITMISDVAAVSDLMVHHLRDLLRMIDSDVLK